MESHGTALRSRMHGFNLRRDNPRISLKCTIVLGRLSPAGGRLRLDRLHPASARRSIADANAFQRQGGLGSLPCQAGRPAGDRPGIAFWPVAGEVIARSVCRSALDPRHLQGRCLVLHWAPAESLVSSMVMPRNGRGHGSAEHGGTAGQSAPAVKSTRLGAHPTSLRGTHSHGRAIKR
jgi:hypothetical protein